MIRRAAAALACVAALAFPACAQKAEPAVVAAAAKEGGVRDHKGQPLHIQRLAGDAHRNLPAEVFFVAV